MRETEIASLHSGTRCSLRSLNAARRGAVRKTASASAGPDRFADRVVGINAALETIDPTAYGQPANLTRVPPPTPPRLGRRLASRMRAKQAVARQLVGPGTRRSLGWIVLVLHGRLSRSDLLPAFEIATAPWPSIGRRSSGALRAHRGRRRADALRRAERSYSARVPNVARPMANEIALAGHQRPRAESLIARREFAAASGEARLHAMTSAGRNVQPTPTHQRADARRLGARPFMLDTVTAMIGGVLRRRPPPPPPPVIGVPIPAPPPMK